MWLIENKNSLSLKPGMGNPGKHLCFSNKATFGITALALKLLVKQRSSHFPHILRNEQNQKRHCPVVLLPFKDFQLHVK